MKIELLSWKSRGLRCPDGEIVLERPGDKVPVVALVQMPNGTGKTTTLDCLRAAMDGSAQSWPSEQVRQFKGASDGNGEFIATLRVNGRRLVIEMTFDWDEGAVTYRTTIGTGSKPGYAPPPDVKRYLDPRFSALLFFNGELANDLLTGTNDTNASSVIDTFYGLYHLKDLRDQAVKSYETYMQKRKAVSRESEITRRNEALERVESRRRVVRKQVEEAKAKITALGSEIAALDSSISTRLLESSKFKAEEATALKARQEAEDRRKDIFHQIDIDFANPVFLNPSITASLVGLADHLDALTLPEPTSRAFFDDLLRRTDCICGRPLDENARTCIRHKAEEILGDEIHGFLNQFKYAARRQGETVPERDFQKLIQNLVAADDAVGAAESALNDIRTRAALEGDKQLIDDKEKLEGKKVELKELEALLEEATRPSIAGDREEGICLDYFDKRITQIRNELAELTGSMDKKRRTDMLVALLNAAYEQAHEKLKLSVIKDANEQLLQVLRYNPVQIAGIDESVRLVGRSGASVGQNLSVGYVFLAGLLHGGGNQFPFVVDSPTGSLDDEARKNLGELLPKLVKQFVGFVIPPEREYFVDRLEAAAGKDVLYITELRLNEHTRDRWSKLGGTVVSKSETGVVLEGREAFMKLGDDFDNNGEA